MTKPPPDAAPTGADAPPPPDSARDALFLDFDGTLTEIVEHPDMAGLTPYRRNVLDALAPRFGGAVALISGRPVAELTAFADDALWRVGGHGHEVAPPGESGRISVREPDPALLAAAEGVAASHTGVFVEIKSTGLALHYRQNPDAAEDAAAAMEQAVTSATGYVLQYGKMVVEARPKGADKGSALRMLMEQQPFAGRRPVMIGDDLTDEIAMEAALALGGAAIKVGAGETCAPWRLESPEAVYAWLAGSD